MNTLLFLGSGAADWVIENRNGFFRRNSAALVNGELMLDCGAHIFDFAECAGNPALYNKVKTVLITHNHSDHFRPESVRRIADDHPITVGCDAAVKAAIGEHPNITFILLRPHRSVTLGGYEILPLMANHDIVAAGDNFAFHYIVKMPDGRELFYGLDGAWFLRPTWNEMLRHKFDVMVFDCTVGDQDDWRLFEHNTIPMLRKMTDEIKAKSLMADGGQMIASHMARTLHISHEDTQAVLEKIGMLTAYDGMTAEF